MRLTRSVAEAAPRVAHVLRKYDPAEWGGTETHVVAITRELSARGWGVEIHAPAGPTAADHALASGVALRRFDAFCPYLGDRTSLRALRAAGGNIVSLEEPLRLARDRSLSLAHVHTSGRIAGGVRTAMRLTGRPYVISAHGPVMVDTAILAEESARRQRGAWDVGGPFGLLLGARRVLDDAARILVFNEPERAALAARHGDRAVCMDHGVDAARFAGGDAGRARARWPELGEGPVVALVGRMAAQKNQALAVAAFARGAPPDHRLALAGAETDPGYRASVEREARALGVADRVHFLGNVRPADVPDLLARSSLVLVPSTHETFGLAVLEGWAADRPVLFARRSALAGLAQALGGEAGAAVPTLDVDAWAAAMGRMLASEPDRRAAAAAGAALVRARFDWTRVATRLIALYAEVIEEARRSPAPHAARRRAAEGRTG
ncbi:glycosyltransferase family 4 protein [Sorangium sp. So ce119]|uniref:glycosyltransferase family 4 protein n=1 Tax=Sorangium sp. So ce119 TaxID=3133279 RepID=UPI003F649027